MVREPLRILCLGAMLCAGTLQAEEPTYVLTARLIKVIDGDTVRVRLDSGPMMVRLHGIDSPERNQASGADARNFLRGLIRSGDLEIEPVEQRDRYDRMVGRIYVRGEDVNAQVVEAGFAWAYREYLGNAPGDRDYCTLEASARAARRGLWARNPETWEAPWDFRHKARGERVAEVSYAGETAASCKAAARQARARSARACGIKGNISSNGVRIYHVPGSPFYAATRIDTKAGERWFCSIEEARAAGWRAAR
jgi:endonuclease YncB( thermonuclease family)